jgi:hypothetical protein
MVAYAGCPESLLFFGTGGRIELPGVGVSDDCTTTLNWVFFFFWLNVLS